MSRYQILENYVNDDESVAAYEQAEEHYANEEDIEFNAAYEQAAEDYIWAISARHQEQHPEEYENNLYAEQDPQAEDEEYAGETQAEEMAEEVLAEEEDPAEETLAEEGQEQYEDRLQYAEGDADTLELAEDEDDTGLAAMPQMFNGDCERASAFMDSWDLWSGQLSPIFSQYQLATIFLSLFRDPVDQWAEERLAQIEEWRATDMEDDDEDILEDTIGRFVEEFVPRDDAREQYVAAEDPDADDWSSVDDEDPYSREVPSPPSLCSDDQASEEEPDEVNEYVEEPHGDAREEYGCQDEVDDYYYSDDAKMPAEAVKEYEDDLIPDKLKKYFAEAADERPDSESEERVTPVPRKQKKRKTQAVKQEPAKKKTVRIAVEEDELPRAKLPPSIPWEKKFITKFGKGRLNALREAGIPDYLIEADVIETPVNRKTMEEQVQELTELYHARPDLQEDMWNATVAPAAEQASWKGPNTFSVPAYQAAPADPTPASWGSADATAAQESRAAENTGWFAYQSNPDAMDLTAGRAYARNQAKCHHCWSTGHTRRNCPNRDAPRKRTWIEEYNDDDEDPLPRADSPLAAPRGRSPTVKPVYASDIATYAPTTRYTPGPTRFVVQASPPQRRAVTPSPSPISDVGFTRIQHPSPVSPMTDEEFADRLADMQIRRMQAELYGDTKKARDISMRMNLAEYARSLNRPASVPRQRGRCSRREGNVTVSPQTVPRAPYATTPNTIRRRTAEDDAYEQAEIRRLVADHAKDRAKSPTPHYIPGSAHQRDPEFWE
ncbi:hypothetical protein EDB83DRAFT_2517266 [Lactarius deliciosus]|nr:hypothetical protein EDB83DRAFT_2517266 [Lactarius deliciosus]